MRKLYLVGSTGIEINTVVNIMIHIPVIYSQGLI